MQERIARERKTIPTVVRKVESTDDTTKLLVKVTSFGSPDNKDLGGDYFKPECDFGDKRVKQVKAFYDHALNTETNPFAKTEQQLIGSATLKEVDEEGRWFVFEVEKSNAYHDAILALNDMKILGASTQAYVGGVDRAEDGGISRWWESEVTLTVTPMDQKTIGETFLYLEEQSEENDSLKSLIEDWKALLEEEAAAEAEAAKEIEETPESDETQETPENEGEEDSFADEIAGMLSETEEDLDPEIEGEYVAKSDFIMLTEKVDELNQKLSGVISAYVDIWGDMTEGEDIANLLTRIVASQETTNKAVIDVKKAVRHMAEHTADVVSNQVQKALKGRSVMSNWELDAEDLLGDTLTEDGLKTKPTHVFPDHAPGGN